MPARWATYQWRPDQRPLDSQGEGRHQQPPRETNGVLNIGPGGEKRLDDLHPPLRGGAIQGVHAALAEGVRVHARGEHLLDLFQVPGVRRVHELLDPLGPGAGRLLRLHGLAVIHLFGLWLLAAALKQVDRHLVLLRGGEEVKLTPKEFELLSFLARHPGKVVTHKQILTAVWGPAHSEDTQYLRVYMRQLRRKIEADPERPKYLLTETGVGYRLRVD